MGITFEIKSVMTIECIQITLISSEFLDLYGSQKKELFCFIFHSFSKEFIDLSFKFLDAFSLESKTVI